MEAIKIIEITENIMGCIVFIMFCIFLYTSFCKRPKINKKKNKKEIIKYEPSPYNEYIESIWEELKKK